LLAGELSVVTAFEPQSLHDFGVQKNHHCQGQINQSYPRQRVSLLHPPLRKDFHAVVAVVLCPNFRDKEQWNIEDQGEEPNARNDNLKWQSVNLAIRSLQYNLEPGQGYNLKICTSQNQVLPVQ